MFWFSILLIFLPYDETDDKYEQAIFRVIYFFIIISGGFSFGNKWSSHLIQAISLVNKETIQHSNTFCHIHFKK